MFLRTNGGAGRPYVKYNGKAGRYFLKEEAGEVEVATFIAVFDLENAKTGYFRFAEGAAPEFVFDTETGEAKRPGDGFKRGFVVDVFSVKNLGGVRELASSANVTIEALQPVYEAYLSAPERAKGLLPLVKHLGIEPVKSKEGTNYRPKWTIEKWVARPPEFAQFVEEFGKPGGTGPVAAGTTRAPTTTPGPAPAAVADASEY
jgi:hypothetical protein